MTAVNRDALQTPLPTVLSLLDTVLSTHEGVKYTARKRSAKFKFTSDLIFDHLEGISKNSKDIQKLCLEQDNNTTRELNNSEMSEGDINRSIVDLKEKNMQQRQMKKEQLEIESSNNDKNGQLLYNDNDDMPTSRFKQQQRQPLTRKRKKPQQVKLQLLSEDGTKHQNVDNNITDGIGSNSKKCNEGFSIDNILGRSDSNGETNTSNNRIKNEESTATTASHEEQNRRLPNISQFFQPIDEHFKFTPPPFITQSSCTQTTRCGITSQPTTSNALLKKYPFTTPLDDCYPLLRNSGKLEFRPVNCMQNTIQAPVTLTLESKENIVEKLDLDKPKRTHNNTNRNEPKKDVKEASGSVSSGRGYKCEKCGKIYCRKYVLKIHMRTHTGDKPLKCDICGKSFSDPSNMKKHIKLHETDHVTYPCKFCGRNFVRRRGLLNHLHSMHSRFPFAQNQ